VWQEEQAGEHDASAPCCCCYSNTATEKTYRKSMKPFCHNYMKPTAIKKKYGKIR